MEKYISREAAFETLSEFYHHKSETQHIALREALNRVPTADVVSAEDYKHLLRIANKMHLWIFNHTFDEQAAYDECGLTDEDNAMLGYGGSWELRADRADSAE